MAIRQRKKPNKDGKRPWLAELPDPKRPGRTVRIGTYPTEEEAKTAEFKAEQKRREGRLNTNKNSMTVADLIREFLKHQKARHEANLIRRSTLAIYTQRLESMVLPILGHVKLRDLNRLHICDWQLEAGKRSPKGTSIEHAKTNLRAALEYAADDDRGWLTVGNVLVMFRKLPPLKRKPQRRHGSPEEFERFFIAIRRRAPQFELPCLIGYTTGMRLGEVAGLRWESCDFGNRYFNVAHSSSWQSDGLTKSGKVRPHVEMVADVFHLLSERWESVGRPPRGHVFPGKHGATTIYQAMRYRLRIIMKELGFTTIDQTTGKLEYNFSFHSFRRNYVSEINEALGLEYARQSVGHVRLEQTQAYCRPVPPSPRRRNVVELIAANVKPRLALPAPDTTNDTTKTQNP